MMFWWEPESSGAVMIVRAVPGGGQVVCVGGIARVAGVVPVGVKPLCTGDGMPGVGDVCLVIGVAFEPQAASSNRKIRQHAMKGKLRSLRVLECIISPTDIASALALQ